MAQPPGMGILILPRLARSGPIIKNDARSFVALSRLFDFKEEDCGSIVSVFDASKLYFAPDAAISAHIFRISVSCGILCRVVFSSDKRDAAIIGKAAFFEPLIFIFPSGFEPGVIKYDAMVNNLRFAIC